MPKIIVEIQTDNTETLRDRKPMMKIHACILYINLLQIKYRLKGILYSAILSLKINFSYKVHFDIFNSENIVYLKKDEYE